MKSENIKIGSLLRFYGGLEIMKSIKGWCRFIWRFGKGRVDLLGGEGIDWMGGVEKL